MDREIWNAAEALAACLRELPVTLTISEGVGAYSVRTRQGRCIWADDLPAGGYAELLRALSLLIAAPRRRDFMETFSAEQLEGGGSTLFAAADASSGRWLRVEGSAARGSIVLDVSDAP